MSKIGLLLIATGKYDTFVDLVVASARRFLFNNHELTFFLFTDSERFVDGKDMVVIPHQHQIWPYPTLYRYKTFNTHRKYFDSMDYLYYCDVDMQFVDIVGDEAIGDRVATLHPGYVGTSGTPERDPRSLAYIPVQADNKYFAGGFNGGRRDNFLNMCSTIDRNIDTDMQQGIIAVWHDESHMNRYFLENQPTVVLDPGYCYGESMNIPYHKRLLALNKNHELMRS